LIDRRLVFEDKAIEGVEITLLRVADKSGFVHQVE